MLTKEAEIDLANDWFYNHDEKALHHLIVSYTRLAVSMALKYRHYGVSVVDLIQEGHLGLMQAAKRFDPTRNIRFSGYAKWWVRAYIQDFILRNWSIVRTGSTTGQKQLFFNLARLRAQLFDIHTHALGGKEKQKIAKRLNVSIKDVDIMETRLASHDCSLSKSVFDSGNSEWQDLLEDKCLSPEASLIAMRDNVSRQKWLKQAMMSLNAREKTIIQKHCLDENPVTLIDIGKDLNISKERVRQLEVQALRKMRFFVAKSIQDIKDFL